MDVFLIIDSVVISIEEFAECIDPVPERGLFDAKLANVGILRIGWDFTLLERSCFDHGLIVSSFLWLEDAGLSRFLVLMGLFGLEWSRR